MPAVNSCGTLSCVIPKPGMRWSLPDSFRMVSKFLLWRSPQLSNSAQPNTLSPAANSSKFAELQSNRPLHEPGCGDWPAVLAFLRFLVLQCPNESIHECCRRTGTLERPDHRWKVSPA